jgi:hypothetical protein
VTTFGIIVLAGLALAFVVAVIHPIGRAVFIAQLGGIIRMVIGLLIVLTIIALWGGMS